MKREYILKNLPLLLAIIGFVLIGAIFVQVNSWIRELTALQNRQETFISTAEQRFQELRGHSQRELEITRVPEQKEVAWPALYGVEIGQKIAIDYDLTGWLTYKNERFGFEIKYPKTWKINQTDSAPGQLAVFAIEDPASPLQNLSAKFCTMTIYENENNLSVKDWLNKAGIYAKPGTEGFIITNVDITVTGNVVTPKIHSAGPNLSRMDSIFIPRNTKIYVFRYLVQFETDQTVAVLRNKELCERITHTFKFID